MSSAVKFTRDASGQNTFAPDIDGVAWRYDALLLQDIEQNFTLPRNTVGPWVVSFSAPGGEVWYSFSPPYVASPTTAAYPTGAIAASDSEANTGSRTMQGETYISMITPSTSVRVSIVGYYSPLGS